ncbi:MAG TPA: hypothetical protein VLG66_03855 [Alphaproteobacteria bacterium]|nr:hypothetical protein [Alphaproteobacteria bacterium]
MMIERRLRLRAALTPFVALLLAGMLVACEEEGPAEKLGKKIDQTAEDAAKAIEDTTK